MTAKKRRKLIELTTIIVPCFCYDYLVAIQAIISPKLFQESISFEVNLILKCFSMATISWIWLNESHSSMSSAEVSLFNTISSLSKTSRKMSCTFTKISVFSIVLCFLDDFLIWKVEELFRSNLLIYFELFDFI